MAEDFYIKDPTSANPQVVVHRGCNAPCILKTGVNPLFLAYMHWRCTKCHRTFSDKTIGRELQWQRYTSQPTYTPDVQGHDAASADEARSASHPPSNDANIAVQLTRLAELRAAGVLTEDEFSRAKQRSLDASTNVKRDQSDLTSQRTYESNDERVFASSEERIGARQATRKDPSLITDAEYAAFSAAGSHRAEATAREGEGNAKIVIGVVLAIIVTLLSWVVGSTLSQPAFWIIVALITLAVVFLRKRLRATPLIVTVSLIGVLVAYNGSFQHDRAIDQARQAAEQNARIAAQQAGHDREARQNHERRLAYNLAHPAETASKKAALRAKLAAEQQERIRKSAASVVLYPESTAVRHVTEQRADFLYPSLQTACEYFKEVGADPSNDANDSIEHSLGILETKAGDVFEDLGTSDLTCPGSELHNIEYTHVRGLGQQGWVVTEGVEDS